MGDKPEVQGVTELSMPVLMGAVVVETAHT